MEGQERITTENLLIKLEELEYPFPLFELYKKDNQIQSLGHGGFSTVYEMVDRENANNHYALKVIGMEKHVVSSDVLWNTFRMQRMLCEYSPYVVRTLVARELLVKMDEDGKIKEVLDANGERWTKEGFLLQFVLMEKLDNVLQKDKFGNASLINNRLTDEKEVLTFATQIGQAIMTAHENHILHRDIKLENIFWDAKEECFKLGDFGIAKYTAVGNAETMVYTDGYGAPEIERRLEESYNATADIYSFGITLYLLLNELRFPGSEGYYVNPVQYDPEYVFPAPMHASAAMARMIRKMCSYRKEDRYQSMQEVLSELKHIGEALEQKPDEVTPEFSDFETEVYNGEKTEEEKEEKQFDVEKYLKQYEEDKKTRAGRKRIRKEIDDYYHSALIRHSIWFTLLFVLLFKGLQTDSAFITDWHFWVLPIAVLIEAIFMKMKEFHIIFGVLVIALAIYSISIVGLTVPHMILILCVLTMYPNVALAGAAGTGLWMYLELTGKLSGLSFVAKNHLSWIIILALLVMLHSDRNLRMEYTDEQMEVN